MAFFQYWFSLNNVTIDEGKVHSSVKSQTSNKSQSLKIKSQVFITEKLRNAVKKQYETRSTDLPQHLQIIKLDTYSILR